MVGDGGNTKHYLQEDNTLYGTVIQVVLVVQYGTEVDGKIACIQLVAQDPLIRETGCHKFIFGQIETHMTLDLNISMLFMWASENTENFYGDLNYVITM